MVKELKKQIDIDQNQAIEEKELLDFLQSQENLKSLEAVLKTHGKEQLLETLPHLEQALENSLNTIYKRINEENGKNQNPNFDAYSISDGILIQLYANIKYGENLTLTGRRHGNDENAKKTNLYMWKFELERRGGMIEYRKNNKMKDYSDLLDIPNLSELLSVVGSQEQQNRILDKFLDFFLNDVKVKGMYFENQIGNENLTALLNYFILAERNPEQKITLDGGQEKTRLEIATELKNEIKHGVSANVERNDLQSLNNNVNKIYEYIEKVDSLTDEDKKLITICFKEAFSSLEKINNPELKKKLLITLPLFFTQEEILHFYEGESEKGMIDEISQIQSNKKEWKRGGNTENLGDALPIRKNGIQYIQKILSIPGHRPIVFQIADHNCGFQETYQKYNSGAVVTKLENYITRIKNGEKLILNGAKVANGLNDKESVVITVNEYTLSSLFTSYSGDETLNSAERIQKGKKLVEDLGRARNSVGEDQKTNEPINDILAQVDQQTEKKETAEGIGIKWGMQSLTEYGDELVGAQDKRNKDEQDKRNKKDNRDDARNTAGNEAWSLFDSIRPQESKAVMRNPSSSYVYAKDQFAVRYQEIPYEFKRIMVPGAKPIYMRIERNQENTINALFQGANSGKFQLILLNYYKQDIKLTGLNASSTGYDYYELEKTRESSKNKNRLVLTDFAISETDKNGNINLYKVGPNGQKGEKIRTITTEEQYQARNANQLALMSMQTPELRKIYKEANRISTEMGDIDKLSHGFVEEAGKWIEGTGKMSDDDAEKVRTKATALGKSLQTLVNDERKLQAMQQQLKDMLNNIDKNTLTSDEEIKLQSTLEKLNFVLEGIGPNGVITQFAELMSNPKNIKSNDTRWKNVRNWLQDNGIKMLVAIGAAVLAIVVTVSTFGVGAGVGGLLVMGAVGTAGGMVGSRVGQFANEALQNATLYRDKDYTYKDPTDIELLVNGAIQPADFIKNVSAEFLIGTLTTAAFMGTGQIIGKGLGIWATNAASKGITRPQTMLNKITLGKFSTGDTYTQQIFGNAAKNGIKDSALRHFTKEFGQEIFEESYEQGAEQLGNALHVPALATLASIYSCLTPGPGSGKIFAENKIQFNSLSALKPDGNSGATTTLELTYDGSLEKITEYYTSLKEGAFIYNGKNQTLSRKSAFAKEGKVTEVIKLTPSKVSADIRAMGPTLSSEYGIEIDHKNGTLLAFDPTKFSEFEKNIQKHGLGQVVTDENGNMKWISGKETIQVLKIKPHPDLVRENAKLDDKARIPKASELLKEKILTEAQEKAILEAHNQEGTIYNLTSQQIRARVEILQHAGFTGSEIRILFENGIVGKKENTQSAIESQDEMPSISPKEFSDFLRDIESNPTEWKEKTGQDGPIEEVILVLNFFKDLKTNYGIEAEFLKGFRIDDIKDWKENITPQEIEKVKTDILQRKDLLRQLGIDQDITKSERKTFEDIRTDNIQQLIEFQQHLTTKGSSLETLLEVKKLALSDIELLSNYGVSVVLKHKDTIKALLGRNISRNDLQESTTIRMIDENNLANLKKYLVDFRKAGIVSDPLTLDEICKLTNLKYDKMEEIVQHLDLLKQLFKKETLSFDELREITNYTPDFTVVEAFIKIGPYLEEIPFWRTKEILSLANLQTLQHLPKTLEILKNLTLKEKFDDYDLEHILKIDSEKFQAFIESIKFFEKPDWRENLFQLYEIEEFLRTTDLGTLQELPTRLQYLQTLTGQATFPSAGLKDIMNIKIQVIEQVAQHRDILKRIIGRDVFQVGELMLSDFTKINFDKLEEIAEKTGDNYIDISQLQAVSHMYDVLSADPSISENLSKLGIVHLSISDMIQANKIENLSKTLKEIVEVQPALLEVLGKSTSNVLADIRYIEVLSKVPNIPTFVNELQQTKALLAELGISSMAFDDLQVASHITNLPQILQEVENLQPTLEKLGISKIDCYGLAMLAKIKNLSQVVQNILANKDFLYNIGQKHININNLENINEKIGATPLETLTGLLHKNFDLSEVSIEHSQKLFDFIEKYKTGNKGYTIMMLTAKLMLENGTLPNELCGKLVSRLENYQKVLDMYDTKQIPDGLQVSLGMEFEITTEYAKWYHEETERMFKQEIQNLTNIAHIGQGADAVHEIATFATDNPYTMLLEIHLLQELNMIDFNDPNKTRGASRKGTGMHLSLGGKSGVSRGENTFFLQNFASFLPRSGIANGGEIERTNSYAGMKDRGGDITPVFEGGSLHAIEVRTYSIDRVETFEKNMLFHTYATMGIQAVEKFTRFQGVVFKKALEQGGPAFSSSANIKDYLTKSNLRQNNPDTKTQNIVAEFLFLQAKALKTLNDHNDNFMQREVWEGDNANYSRFQSALELNETMDGYFKEKLHINPQRMFEELNIDLANKIIHLNNFFIKKDITNANNVLQFSKVNGATEILIVDGSEVDHRDKQSVFETGGVMRQGYNYYQGGSSEMILHKMQTLALQYTQNIQSILSSTP